jgi:D-threonate/D-erythronate kinase
VRRSMNETGNSLNFLVIADDLSGAADCAAAFSGGCVKPVVHLWPRSTGDVITPAAIDIDSRRMTESMAVAAVRTAVLANFSGSPLRIYKKIDSTLRGHIGVEIAAALETICAIEGRNGVSGGTLRDCGSSPKGMALIAPAYPSLHRVIREGRLVLTNRPREANSDAAHESGALKIDLPTTLKSAGLTTAHLDLAEVRSELSRLHQRLMRLWVSGCRAVVCDAESDDDLVAIARASLKAPSVALWVGSAGLAKKLAAVSQKRIRSSLALPSVAGQIVTVVGSAAQTSRQQATHLAATSNVALLTISKETLRLPESSTWRKVLAEIVNHIEGGHDVLLTLEEGGSLFPLDQSLTSALAVIVSRCIAQVGAIIVTGGDTARAIFDRLGVTRLTVEGEIENGVVAVTARGAWCGTAVIKAGAFGDANALLRAHAMLATRRNTRY